MHTDESQDFGSILFKGLMMEDPNLFENLAITDASSTLENEASLQQEVLVREKDWENDERCWAEIPPDVLAVVFSHLSVEERLYVIPYVCRRWECVSRDAACWRDIDLSSCYYFSSISYDEILPFLVKKSQGNVRRVCVPYLRSDSMLQLIASSASQLQVLEIAHSSVSEECLCELAPKFSALTFLDISDMVPSKTLLESFGKHCPSLTRLNLNMGLMDEDEVKAESCDVAALAISQYMPQLQHLEMADFLLSNAGLKALLSSCKDLKHLDLSGCEHINMADSSVLEATKMISVFIKPERSDDDSEYNYGDDYGSCNDQFDYFGSP